MTVRFHGELGDFLAVGDRGRDLVVAFYGPTSVKDRIESLGVPHTEVELILVDGAPVTFAHRLSAGERVEVHPRFAPLPVPPEPSLRGSRPHPARFVADVHVATLARNLRLLGFDTLWPGTADDDELAVLSATEARILLTRDRRLLQRAIVEHGYFVRRDDPLEQTIDVAGHLGLLAEARPFSRCLVCNDLPVSMAKAEIDHLLEPGTRREHDTFSRCPGCGRLYWRGSHHRRLAAVVDEIVSGVGEMRA